MTDDAFKRMFLIPEYYKLLLKLCLYFSVETVRLGTFFTLNLPLLPLGHALNIWTGWMNCLLI